ncbi:MAG: S9 family peptidase [Lachnospiraceae bacterium]|nr:S9 family peptidase [Lachnospiraceae bacterium]
MGEALEWKRLPYTVQETAFVDEEHFFFTAVWDRQWEELLSRCDGQADQALKQKKENGDFRVFEEIPFWSNGAGDISGVRSRLYYYHEGQVFALSSQNAQIEGLVLSPEKKTLAFCRQEYEGKAPETNELMTLCPEEARRLAEECMTAGTADGTAEDAGDALSPKKDASGDTQKRWYSLCRSHILWEGAVYHSIDFHTDTRAVVTLNRRISHGLNENAGFLLWNPETDETRLIHDGNPWTCSPSEGSDVKMGNIRSDFIFDESGFVMLSTVTDHTPLIHVGYDGSMTEITGRHMVQEVIPAEDGYTVIAMTGMDGNEIYHVARDGSFTPLSSFNSHLSREYEVIAPREFTFINENGLEITGFVIPPAGMEEGKKYPAILDIHGGPKTVYGPHFFHEMQYWANEGFAVLFTNPTGGDGRGNDFMDIRGKYGTADYRDLMLFVDEAVARFDFLDDSRLGVTGGSYGGFMTNWIIGHTDRFRAAASQRSISSWLSFSNTTDIGYFFNADQSGVTAWEDHEKLWELSPLKYASQVTTPTLFLHSDEDTRCWMAEGIQMFYALKNFGVPSRLVLFHKENHDLSRSGRPKSRIRRNEEILRWMKKYL